jgi:hypothetical protein
LAVSSGDQIALVSALEVLEGDEVMVVMASGTVNRLQTDEIPPQGRRTQGRPLVQSAAGDRVVEVTRAYSEKGGSKSGLAEGSDAETMAAQELEVANERSESEVEESRSVRQLDLLG